jgi:leader peptidase (prepilin peptidase)/N-methyltransferase
LFLPLLGPLLVWRFAARRAPRAPTSPATSHSALAASLGRLALAQAAQGALWAALAARYGISPLLPICLAEGTLLLAVLFIDVRHRLIPHALVLPGAVLALATSPLWPGLGLASSALAGAGAFLVFSLLVRLARRVFGEGAFGQGDANLAGWIGLLCGYPLVIVSLSVGVFLGGLGALAIIVWRRGSLRATMPYGPYLVAGVLYVLLSGNTLHSPFTYV